MVPVGEVNIVLLRILNKMTSVSIASKFLTVIIWLVEENEVAMAPGSVCFLNFRLPEARNEQVL